MEGVSCKVMLLLMLTLTTGVYSPLSPLTVPGHSDCFVLSFIKSPVKCKNSCENSMFDIRFIWNWWVKIVISEKQVYIFVKNKKKEAMISTAKAALNALNVHPVTSTDV